MFNKLKNGLKKSREGLLGQFTGLFSRASIDENFWENIEEALIRADIGIGATTKILNELKNQAKKLNIKNPEELKDLFKREIVKILTVKNDGVINKGSLNILLLVGVNGVGKTTTLAKMANKFINSGDKVIFAAADTFRAAAIEQLQEWGTRLGVDVIKHQRGGDPAAVVFDAISAARAREADIVLVDTAGRLHTNINLMEELKKIKKVTLREASDGTVKTVLVMDATTGQNGISQAKLFNDALDLDAIILTKLDGTAKGGIVVAIEEELNIPIWFIGVGEKPEDLQDFNPQEFVDAFFE
ncbi:signal recognition particle-docking protein FtsY [Candidatus Oleimmundimicrobium sp.]|uniref:signal recognition particle-docking protein FtsY n=1 Tax=Candidatus Oleimmundimicrobium sp. TaxID=3060597 RepID=UPI00271E2DB1|nr:signal recognition particle-docking protein FtsY [Candidatus Oleimmundimicrobium sp.]MDO8885360.1 signal recognition particle-docking protein FtsY [Candidatus Oleimmundimicrobium sp.]